MSNPLHAAVPAAFGTGIATLIAADSTRAKVLVEPQAAAAAGATSPLFLGGASVLDITAASTDSANKDVQLWLGSVATTVGASTGSTTTTTSTIVRTSGDFIADGWEPGDLVMIFGARGAAAQAVDGVLGIVSGVAALTLTVNGTPFSALTLTTGARICRMAHLFRAPVALDSGTNGTVASAGLLNNALDGSAIRYERKLAENELLAVSAQAAVSALPAYISVNAPFARY